MAKKRRLIILLCLFTVLVMANPTSAATSTRVNETEDFVDATSNLHDPANKGTNSSFTAMQALDLTNNTLTEEDTGGGQDTEDFIDQISDLHYPSEDHGTQTNFGYMQAGPDDNENNLQEQISWSASTEWCDVDNYDGSYSSAEWTLGTTSPYLDAQDSDVIYTKTDGAYEGYFTFANTSAADITDGIALNFSAYGMADDGPTGEYCYLHWGHNGTYYATDNFGFDTTYGYKTVSISGETFTYDEVNDMQFWLGYDKQGGADEIYVDHLRMGVTVSLNTSRMLDFEYGWTAADYDETNEELCVYSGYMPSENCRVDVWNDTDSAWVNVFTDLVYDGWNNVSISSHLVDSTLEIRFYDGDRSSDTSSDHFNIDVVLIHAWSAGANYELDLEYKWTAADYDESVEELCIFAGPQNAEALKVDIWTGTWTNVIADLVWNQWNNVSISSYLTDATVEIRFLGGTESGDSSESTWEIDAVLIHTYSYAYTEIRYEDTTIDETISTAAEFAKDFTESITIDESITTLVTVVKALFEALAVGVSLATTAAIKKLFSESVTINETLVNSFSIFRTFFEGITFDETVYTQQLIQKYLFEAVVVTATASTVASFSRRLGESITLSPTFNEIGTFARELFDSIVIEVTTTATKTGGNDYVKNLFESIGFADGEALVASFVRVLSESIVISDTISTTFVGLWIKNLFESILFSENDVWADYRAVTTTTTFNPDKRRYIIPPLLPPNLVLASLGFGAIVWIYFYGVPYIPKSEATAYYRRMKLKRELRRALKPILGPLGRAKYSSRRENFRSGRLINPLRMFYDWCWK